MRAPADGTGEAPGEELHHRSRGSRQVSATPGGKPQALSSKPKNQTLFAGREMTSSWLTLIGTGEDGRLAPGGGDVLARADIVYGGTRHLEMAGPLKAEKEKLAQPVLIRLWGS
ncbi:hypothetical protein QW131_27525 [Roseibium salinum]|nr:hypothetical protein [Roseibium salinum]